MIPAPAYSHLLPGLAPPDPHWGGMGAVPLIDDPRDYSLLLHPGVAQALHAGATGPVDLSSFIGGVLNQGAEGSCVAASTAALCALDEALAGRPWLWLDFENLYHRNGGTGQNGIDSRQCLADVVANGVNRLNAAGSPIKEASYLFVPKQPGLFRETIMAALNVRKPCVIATLLPDNFGWSSSGSPTSGYHQMLVCGGDETWCEVQNSWGAAWGNNGKGRLPWDYLQPTRWDVFSYAVEPLGVPVPPPVPTPTPGPTPGPGPTPTPTPPPVNTLTMLPALTRYGAICAIVVRLTGPQGQALNGTVGLTIDGQGIGHKYAHSTRPAVFLVQEPAGLSYSLDATAGALSATATGTLP